MPRPNSSAAAIRPVDGPALLTTKTLTGPGRLDGRVSEWSRWSDPVWYFSDPARERSHYGAAVWDYEMMDGTCFLDPQYVTLLEACRIVTYCLHRGPAMRAPLKPETINEVSLGLRYWMRWLCEAGYRSLGQVGASAMGAFETYLVADKLNDDLDQELTSSSIARYMRGPFAFWEERSRLAAAGITPLPEVPFPGETAHTVARRLARVALGRIQPLPREILIPLMNRAEWFIEGPARDVLRMVGLLTAEVPSLLKASSDRASRAALGRYICGKVEFSPFDGSPWHRPLTEIADRISAKTLQPKQEDSIELARDLVLDVAACASILIQGTAGLRVSEIEMIEAGALDPETGLPDCIDVRYDATGTIELFYLKSFLVKTTASREPAEWLVGARTVGADHLPPPVHAVLRLYEMASLLDPERTSPRLFLGTTGGAWNFFAGAAVPLERSQIQGLQRAFAANYVDRALLDRLEILRTHAWRKSFAQFVFGVDPGLAPALSQHFKHVHIAMTMEAYVTNDPILLGHLESERAMQTARDLYELTTGRQAGAGRMGKCIAKHADEIAELIADKEKRAAIEALHGFVQAHQVPFWFLEWGDCGITYAPSEAACHAAAGTTSWRNIAPDFAYRDLDVCSGCSRLLVLRRHLPFWSAREDQLGRALEGLEPDASPVFRAAIRTKFQQARAVVKALTRNPEPKTSRA